MFLVLILEKQPIKTLYMYIYSVQAYSS